MHDVIRTYNAIASDFSQTRNHSWADFDLFKKVVQSQMSVVSFQLSNFSVLDVGCGNGRLISFLSPLLYKEGVGGGIHYTGIDASTGMIEQARILHPDCDFHVADMRKLPFDDHSFDIIFAIASFNHMLTKEDQEKTLLEIFRVLKPDGYLCMTNWNLWRPTLKEKSWWKYVIARESQRPKQSHHRCINGEITSSTSGRTRNDRKGSWRVVTTHWNNHPLPYYAFTLRELKRMVKQAGLAIETALYSKNGRKAHWWDGQNILLIGKKKG